MRRPMASPLFGARGRCNGAGVLQSRRARDGFQAGEPASFLSWFEAGLASPEVQAT